MIISLLIVVASSEYRGGWVGIGYRRRRRIVWASGHCLVQIAYIVSGEHGISRGRMRPGASSGAVSDRRIRATGGQNSASAARMLA